MNIETLSTKRGITALMTGDTIFIYSSYYGLVAKGDIVRCYENPDKDYELTGMIITFDICQWLGYWSLKSIITRGINKLYSVPIQYIFNEKDHQMSLKGHLEIKYVDE